MTKHSSRRNRSSAGVKPTEEDSEFVEKGDLLWRKSEERLGEENLQAV